MKKYQFVLEGRLFEQAKSIIREKEDIISLLLAAIKTILLASPVSNNNHRLDEIPHFTIYVDKMSRIIFVVENKMFSFQFPFIIREDQKKDETKLSIFYNQVEIDNKISSLLLAVLNETTIFQGCLSDANNCIDEQILENDWLDIDPIYSYELISHLAFFEPGYLRYDYDIENQNGDIHPLNHLDVYFSSPNAMKIGLNQKIDEKYFLDMLNITSACKYLG